MTQNKIICTLVPLSALHSKKSNSANFEVAKLFLDWLVKTNQNAWKLLPLHETQLESATWPPRHVPSPFKGFGIGLDPCYLPKRAGTMRPSKIELKNFMEENKDWISDYALFCALRDEYQTDDWSVWDEELKTRNPGAIRSAAEKLGDKIKSYTLLQCICHKSYQDFRQKAKEKQILLIGDLPFYIAYKSPLVWAHQELFDLGKNGKMVISSGALNRPGAYFGRQVWGHPLYDWNNKTRQNSMLLLWEMRLRYLKGQFDIVRIDHANGFFHYSSLDPNNPDRDVKKLGPGFRFFKFIIDFSRRIGLPVFAEDAALGLADLRRAMKKLDVAGVTIFRFAYNDKAKILVPHYARTKNYDVNSCAYTTLHDTEPLVGYMKILSNHEKRLLAREVGVEYSKADKVLAARFRQSVINSPSKTVIVPIQDWLLTEDRINTPGTEKEINDPNWSYRIATPVEDLPALQI